MATTCGIFLLNTNKELLLVRPSNNNTWSIPKGMYESDDVNYLNTAKRELFEETDIVLSNIKHHLLFEFDFIQYRNKKKRLKSFLIQLDEDYNKPLKCTSNFTTFDGRLLPENEAFLWYNFSNTEIKLHYTQENIINEIKAKWIR